MGDSAPIITVEGADDCRSPVLSLLSAASNANGQGAVRYCTNFTTLLYVGGFFETLR